mgnify:CR=1 FL=1
MESILSFYQQFMELSKINPLMSGLIAVWVGAISTWALRNVPMRLWSWIKRYSIVTVDISSHTNIGLNPNYASFLSWASKPQLKQLIRSWGLIYGDGEIIGNVDSASDTADEIPRKSRWSSYLWPGFATHYFFHRWRLWWYRKQQIQTTMMNSDRSRETITISGLFVSECLLRSVIEEFSVNSNGNESNKIYIRRSGCWNGDYLQERKLTTVAIPQHTIDTVVNAIKKFKRSRSWYYQKGIPYKLGIELTGLPGSGKTSFVRALAGYFKSDVYVIDLSCIRSGTELYTALYTIDSGSFVVFEDYDSERCLHRRVSDSENPARQSVYVDERITELNKVLTQMNETSKFGMELRDDKVIDKFSLQDFLNAIDGIVPLNDLVIFYTTNHPELLDPAVRRKGRVDLSVELNEIEHDTIKRFTENMFPGETVPADYHFLPIVGCELSAKLLENPDNFSAFVESLPRHNENTTI